MKYIFLLFLFLNSFLLKAQDTTLQSLKTDMCNCFEQNKEREIFNLNKSLQSCITNALEKNQKEIANKAIVKFGTDAEAKFEHYLIDIYADLMIEMVNYCDKYYTYMDSSRFFHISKDKDSLRKMIQYRTYKMDRSLSANFYYYRAEVYYELGDYIQAFKDIDSSLETNSKDYRAMELKGKIMELQHNYKEALRLYEKAYEIEHEKYIEFFKKFPDEYGDDEKVFLIIEMEIVKRKMKDEK